MGKCSQCRKLDAELDTWWDKVRLWCFYRFSRDVIDLTQEKYTQGFSDGYRVGYEHANKNITQNREKLVTLGRCMFCGAEESLGSENTRK